MPNPGRRRLISTTAASLALAAFSAPVLAQDWTAPLATPLYVGTETQAPLAVAAPAPLYSGADTRLVAQPVAQIGVAAQIQPVAAPAYDYGAAEAQAVATPAPTFVAPAAAPQIVSTNPVPGAPVFVESQDEVLTATDPILLDVIVLSAEEQIKQALGVSTITAEDIARHPVLNDISQIIRRQPGVNLTGSTATGQRGNNRQIDLRGMGPENTLILIDGKPVLSRNSVRMGRQGERDSRGDSNWVAPELVERIEVLRGPAAARYGSGSSGGVVNIITKREAEFWSGSITAQYGIPDSGDFGDSQQLSAFASGPVSDRLSAAIWGGLAWQQPGREGVRSDGTTLQGALGSDDYDLNARLTWQVNDGHELEFESGYNKQKYRGDYENQVSRATGSLQHTGDLGFGEIVSLAMIEQTDNYSDGSTIEYTSMILDSRLGVPLTFAGREHHVTGGFELRYEELKDPVNLGQTDPFTGRPASDSADVTTFAVYGEGQFEVNDKLSLTLGARLDNHDEFGSHVSPRVYVNYAITDELMLKAGWSQSFKAPDLRQLDTGWGTYSRGRGCGVVNFGNGCWLIGNPDLQPETSNSYEVGLNFARGALTADVTYFYNDIDDMITVGDTSLGWYNYNGVDIPIVDRINVERARTSGVEAGLVVPVRDAITWTNSLTWMIESKNLDTGAALAAIPEVSFHTDIGWEARENLSLYATWDYYGEQIGPNESDIGAYDVFGLSTAFRPREDVLLRAGVENLFDTQPDSDSGFRETGRTYSVSLTASF